MSTTKEEALVKLLHYCAYQDRCHNEVRTKLLSLKIYGDLLEEIMSDLIDEDFLNEERFAKNFARGKFRMKQWGKVRIQRELKLKGISNYSIRKAMDEVDSEGGYQETLEKVIEKYIGIRKNKWPKHILKQKTFAHAIQKGFESPLVTQTLLKIIN